jgi:hypothetical protein
VLRRLTGLWELGSESGLPGFRIDICHKMAASSLLCNLSTECFSNDYVPEPSGVCFNSETLKCELKNTQDELKSA